MLESPQVQTDHRRPFLVAILVIGQNLYSKLGQCIKLVISMKFGRNQVIND